MGFTEMVDRSAATLEMVEEWQNQPELPPKRKRVREENEDRISRLPDCLLVEILSRLPETKCAVKTGALSKRWKHIWTSVSKLSFLSYGKVRARFNSFVDKNLSQRGQLKLKEFRLRCTYDKQFESKVNNWIRYAINCNVEEVNLELWCMGFEAEFVLDQIFFINSCFTDLTLSGCVLNPNGAISWKILKSLSISQGNLDEVLIENILSGSPVLETLVLDHCCGYRQLNIISKSVEKLVFIGYLVTEDNLIEEYTDVIEINAPNILSLAIQDDLLLLEILLVNVSSLVEAELDYRKREPYETTDKYGEEEMLKGFILNLRHVKELTIGTCCCRALSRLKAKGFSFPSNLKVCGDISYYPDSDDDTLEFSDHSNSYSDDGSTGKKCDSEDDDAIANSSEDDDA